MELMNFSVLTKTSSTPLWTPGSYGYFPDGTLAKYCQMDDALDGTTVDAGEPVVLMPADAAWDDPYRLYLVTNDPGDGMLAAPVGLAKAAVLAEYWGWVVVRGYIADAPAESATYAVGEELKANDTVGSGITLTKCTTEESCIAISLEAGATTTPNVLVCVPRMV